MGWGEADGSGPGAGPGHGGQGDSGGGSDHGGGWGTNYDSYQSDWEGINEDIGVPSDGGGREGKVAKVFRNVFASIFDLMMAMNPLGAFAQAVSKAATGKFITRAAVDGAVKHMKNNPTATPTESLAKGLRTAGVWGKMSSRERSEFHDTSREVFKNTNIEVLKDGLSGGGEAKKWKYGLTAEEREMFDVLENEQIQALTRGVNENTRELAETRLSQLVDRGVLQGNIGRDALAQVYEDSSDAIAQGSAQIRTQSMQNQLSLLSQKYGYGEAKLNRDWQEDIFDKQSDRVDKANKWNAFGNVAPGIIDSVSDDLDWKDYF